jgi:hypothetical protein
MTKLAQDKLAKFGISIAFTENGSVELISRAGVTCAYSSRTYAPVIGFGADGRIMIRLAAKGLAEILINDEKFEYRDRDPSLRMAVAK